MKNNKQGISCIAFSAWGILMAISGVVHAELQFDASMISNDIDSVADLSRFSSKGAQLPGTYFVDVYLNRNSIASRNIRFVSADDEKPENNLRDSTGLMPCLTTKDLVEMGVKTTAFPELTRRPVDQCLSPGRYIPDARVIFDFQKMRLDISIPQVALQNNPRGWIPPEQWDEGISAALMSWQFSGSENHGEYGNSRSQYLNLMSGFNVGPWRLRDNSTWSYYENRYSRKQQWQHINTYLQRAIIPWRSELTIGDSSTSSDVFDPLAFRGVRIATDDEMYPETMRGYAPVVKGIAGSNAEVSIRQNGSVIYRTYVAAGAFVINDLYPLSSGGDLEVAVTEADGSVRVFTVPYSSVPVLQRAGHIRYGMTAGRYRNTSDRYDKPAFMQGTLLMGLPHNLTAYSGVQLADQYRAFALGAGVNLGMWGAASADITQATSTLADGSRHQGQSLRFLFGRSLVSTGTTFQLVGYRYSTEGFHTLDETALKRMSGWMNNTLDVDAAGRPLKQNWVDHYNLYSNKRDRFQANITQRLGDMGSLSLTGTRQTYWNNASTTHSLQAGFSSVFKKINYSVSYGQTRYSGQKSADKTLYLTLSVPLNDLFTDGNNRSLWANYSANRDNQGHITNQVGLSGTALEEGNLNWAVSQGYGRRDGGSGDASLAYQGTYGNASAGYGYSRNYKQFRYGLSGSAVLHSGGLTLGQPLGITNVLVAAPGAAGVPVANATGIRTDARGYTLLPYASMYRENRIALDVNQLDDHTEIDNAVTRVVPTHGALVRADFKTRTGFRVLMTLMHKNQPLPFGSTVSIVGGENSGLVGDGGQVYLSGMALKGELKAKWGQGAEQQCTVRYVLPVKTQSVLVQHQEVCR